MQITSGTHGSFSLHALEPINDTPARRVGWALFCAALFAVAMPIRVAVIERFGYLSDDGGEQTRFDPLAYAQLPVDSFLDLAALERHTHAILLAMTIWAMRARLLSQGNGCATPWLWLPALTLVELVRPALWIGWRAVPFGENDWYPSPYAPSAVMVWAPLSVGPLRFVDDTPCTVALWFASVARNRYATCAAAFVVAFALFARRVSPTHLLVSALVASLFSHNPPRALASAAAPKYRDPALTTANDVANAQKQFEVLGPEDAPSDDDEAPDTPTFNPDDHEVVMDGTVPSAVDAQ